eukprot:TRINITY_DN85247_c0_g1_i1.p1 TRINITY_DN85247_c0_g1~~TRINITY_DN85247_c0_g1_i1.p1  ORF type:complete len:373 (-),score=52.74 TRINITY_DN85247_c0_g1_i1:9-1019(-)
MAAVITAVGGTSPATALTIAAAAKATVVEGLSQKLHTAFWKGRLHAIKGKAVKDERMHSATTSFLQRPSASGRPKQISVPSYVPHFCSLFFAVGFSSRVSFAQRRKLRDAGAFPAAFFSPKRMIVQRSRGGSANFEEGLSLKDMLQIQRQRDAASKQQQQQQYKQRDAESASQELACEIPEIPCVFSPRKQPDYELGSEIQLQFYQERYKKLRQYSSLRTGGAVAVRYSSETCRRSSQANVLFPSFGGPTGVTGLNLGLFDVTTVITVHPFPLVRLVVPADQMTAMETSTDDPSELHAYLCSLNLSKQRLAISEMGLGNRLLLLRWMCSGGAADGR